MKRFKLLLLSSLVMIFFTGCSLIVALAYRLESPPKGWAHDAHLEMLMADTTKQLLTENEKQKASQGICTLKHLDTRKKINHKEAKFFCKLEQHDKIYFYKWCEECGGGYYYLLVRDGKPFESVQIETKLNRELKKNIPIIERLH